MSLPAMASHDFRVCSQRQLQVQMGTLIREYGIEKSE